MYKSLVLQNTSNLLERDRVILVVLCISHTMGGNSSKPPPPPPPVKKEEFQRTWARTTSLTWSYEEQEEMRQSILRRRFDRNNKAIKPKILVFGPTGCGKSSLCNGLVSALEGEDHVSSYFAVGSTSGTFTKGFHPRKSEDIWIIDMGGIFESRSITDENIKNIASGKVAFYEQLSDYLEVKNPSEVPPPGKNDVACVVLVLTLGMEIPDEIKRMLYCIMDLAGQGVVTYRLILTHADLCDEKFGDPRRLPGIFDSRAIQEAVMSIASQTGIPPTAISVVRNYANDTNPDLHTNILLLHALDKIVHAAYEQVQKNDNRAMMREMYDDSD